MLYITTYLILVTNTSLLYYITYILLMSSMTQSSCTTLTTPCFFLGHLGVFVFGRGHGARWYCCCLTYSEFTLHFQTKLRTAEHETVTLAATTLGSLCFGCNLWTECVCMSTVRKASLLWLFVRCPGTQQWSGYPEDCNALPETVWQRFMQWRFQAHTKPAFPTREVAGSRWRWWWCGSSTNCWGFGWWPCSHPRSFRWHKNSSQKLLALGQRFQNSPQLSNS